MPDITKETVEAVVRAITPPTRFTSELPGGVPSLVIPLGSQVVPLPRDPQLLLGPSRITASVKVFDAPSFVAYYSRFQDADSLIFADEESNTITAILDYHAGEAAWCEHRLVLTLRQSDEWVTWTGQDGKAMSQDAFAQFIEDNLADVVEPDPAFMLEVARTMNAHVEIVCDSAARTNSGFKFRYNEIVKGGGIGAAGEFETPGQFKIAISVYQGGPKLPIVCRLRYRISGGKLSMWYDLYRASQAEKDSFTSIRETIASQANGLVIDGSPA